MEKPTIETFLKQIETYKKEAGADLSTAEDLSIAVMNLVSLEEHFFFTGAKTKKKEYFDTAEEIRSMRKDLLAQLMPNHEGETWCISKHLLATTMRLIEVGNKLKSEGRQDDAHRMFARAYTVYSIFWALKVGLVDAPSVRAEAQKAHTYEDLVARLAQCCDE